MCVCVCVVRIIFCLDKIENLENTTTISLCACEACILHKKFVNCERAFLVTDVVANFKL